MEWSGKCGEVGNELLIEVTESYEGSDCLDQFGWFPLFYGFELGWVHKYFAVFDYSSQVFHLSLVKGTLSQFEVEVFLFHPIEHSLCLLLALLNGFSNTRTLSM